MKAKTSYVPLLYLSLALSMALLPALPLAAQSMKRMEFMDKPVQDILMALSMQSGVSIVADETVLGRASFFFPETDFRTALQAFLSAANLYQREERGVIYVSRMNIILQPDGSLNVDAEDIDPSILLRAISRRAARTILFDPLPKTTVTIHSAGLSPLKAVEIVVKPFPDYAVSADKDLIYVKKTESAAAGKPGARASKQLVKAMDGSYSLDFTQARFLDLLDELMRSENKEYALLLRSDIILERMRFSGKGFEQLLRLILEQVGADYALRDGIYYVFEIQKKDVSKKFKDSRILSLKRVGVQDAIALLPQDLANSALYRIDKSSNAIILSGSGEEIGPIAEFLERLDAAPEGRELLRYRTSYLKAKEIIPLIPPRLLPLAPVLSPNEYVFFVQLAPEQKAAFDAFIAQADRKDESYPVRLKYLKVEELLKNLPPSVVKEDLVDSGSPSLVFFQGSAERHRRFMAELEHLDRPKQQIRYDVLAVQYNRTKNLTWEPGLTGNKISGSPLDAGSVDKVGPDGKTAEPSRDAWAVVSTLSNILGINFDVISKLGFSFSAKLNALLSDIDSQIFADTTVTALSGQEAKFQNTNTWRVRQPETDPDTKTTTNTGPTTEVSSGLVLSINGWISGDGMVTMTVSASLSERGSGNDADSSLGIILPTSERVVSTQLRTRSGQPIVISGLIQRSISDNKTKTPILGDIPLLGLLFQKKVKDEVFNELAIYIVPRILETEAVSDSLSLDLESAYLEFGPGAK